MFAANKEGPRSNLAYLEEAYYFVPVHLALQLQARGHYTEALDWFRTVYDYSMPVDQRKIYYGLKREESLPEVFQRADNWLLDPLDPHSIAETRRNSYTRFTLLSITRCLLAFADSHFTLDTPETVPQARMLYEQVLQLLDTPELIQKLDKCDELIGQLDIEVLPDVEPALPLVKGAFAYIPDLGQVATLVNAVKQALTAAQPWEIRLERAKTLIHQARLELPAIPSLATAAAERPKLLAQAHTALLRSPVIAQAMERIGAVAGQDFVLAVSVVSKLPAATLVDEQLKAELPWLREPMQTWLSAGLNIYEKAAIAFMAIAATHEAAAGIASFAKGDVPGGFSAGAQQFSTMGSIASMWAGFERRQQDWDLNRDVAQQDVRIGAQQIRIANDHVRVTEQERVIAGLQSDHAEATVDFLSNKFTNVELYDWMSGILEGVYSFFLQQATAMAKLAENQLAFERQEAPPAFIQADYWEAPSDEMGGSTDGRAPNRHGLTGSALLLQDIYQLDQHAFDTNKRKLQLTKIISLAQRAPAEFQQFRETGVMRFETPMEMFDRDFPGHYLRLIKRVRVLVSALIPPNQGIRATLSSLGLSRAVIGPEVFQTVVIRRPPETIALSSPRESAGLFELTPQMEAEMLLPFEGMGVDTSWEFRMPKAANLFDYFTIADVLVTIDYMALSSFDYYQQVIQSPALTRPMILDRGFSFRQQFADQWYDLNNPEQTKTPMTVRFKTRREDFAQNLDRHRTKHLALYFVRANGKTFEVPVSHLKFIAPDGTETPGGAAITKDGLISTRSGGGGSWTPMLDNLAPFGEWELALPDTSEMRNRFKNGEIKDILFVPTYSGRTPEWPK
jgi:hypothetical protein